MSTDRRPACTTTPSLRRGPMASPSRPGSDPLEGRRMSVTTSEKTTSRGEWAASWPVPVVSAVGMGVSLLPLYSLGALIPSIQHATHWTRAQISFGPTILSIGAVLLAPVVGGAIDRFGARWVALPGLALF